MSGKSLRIAVLGAGPGRDETGGAPGVSTELLDGIARLDHRIDCYLPGRARALPPRLVANENLNFIWGSSRWRWNRWYSRTRVTAFASGLLSRALASLSLRRQVFIRHRRKPYDVLLQLGNIESLGVSGRLAREIPFAMRPDTHMAGALKGLIAERSLCLRCQSVRVYALVLSITAVRVLVQRVRIHRASLVVCVSRVFRDHLVRDYRVSEDATVVIYNPVRLERFENLERELVAPPTVLVLGRISLRKGIEDVVELAKTLLERNVAVRLRVAGDASLFSDYTKLLEDLPPENSEYLGPIPPSRVPAELARSDVLLQPSKYDSFGLTAAEALAAGLPVVATTEVGAIEDVDTRVATAVAPGDVDAMASAIVEMLERLEDERTTMSEIARAEAKRLFAPEVVCSKLSAVLCELAQRSTDGHVRGN